MGNSVPSDNMVKLKELSEKLCKTNNDDYKVIVKKLKTIVDNGKAEIDNADNAQSKIKCYESMCTTITNLLSTVNFK